MKINRSRMVAAAGHGESSRNARVDYLALLRGFDEPDQHEYPLGYDLDELERAVAGAHADLEAALGRSLRLDATAQDASFYADIALPASRGEGDEGHEGEGKKAGRCLARFSNFGRLATILGRQRLSPADDRKVLDVLNQHGFIYIPEKALDEPYAGALPEAWDVRTWRIRFFDYL